MAVQLCALCHHPLPPPPPLMKWLMRWLPPPPVHDPEKFPECERRFKARMGLPEH